MLSGGDQQFIDDLTLAPAGDTQFSASISDQFNAPVLPQGGITSSLGLKAASEVLDRDDLRPASFTATFCAQVTPGPVDVEVTVLRNGKSAAQVRAIVRSTDGDPAGHEITSTFVASRPSDIEFTDAVAPDAKSPEDYEDRWARAKAAGELSFQPTFWEHFESRLIQGHMPTEEWTPTTSEVITWMRWYDTPTAGDGTPSPLALIPPLDTMPGSVFERHGNHDGTYLVPSVDLHVQLYDHRIDPPGTDDGWMLRRNRSRWAGHGLAAAEMELFSTDGRLLAYATQLMHVREVDPSRLA